jgi:CpeT protein
LIANRVKLLLGVVLAASLFWQCSVLRSNEKATTQDLNQLVQFMSGSFSSHAQSVRDSDFFDIRLHIVPIWKNDKDNHWLYVEQATASAESKPYRQRVYKVEQEASGGFKSIVYTLPDPATWAGKFKTPEAFEKLKPEALSLREGCTVYLTKQKDGTFAGATQGIGCESTLREAKYASSKVIITKTELRSWDQGFNEKGEQVWGATKGGYEFVKK